MRLIDFFPLQGTLRPGQPARLAIEIESAVTNILIAELHVYHLEKQIQSHRYQIPLGVGAARHEFLWEPPPVAPRGYGLELQILDDKDQPLGQLTSAIDILNDWREYPRYGFLVDFSESRDDAMETAEQLARYHLNGIQFYDWQYRHDSLLPPTNEYTDPLGRKLSLTTVRDLLDTIHQFGMNGLPYLAVYAASLEYAHAHPDERLYDVAGQPLNFENFLGLVDPTADSAWANHLLAECTELLDTLPFDGLHIDQYGEPKIAFNADGAPVDLPQAFVDFVGAVKTNFPDKTAVFNAVGNWPIDALAVGPQDFLYIEIWPPATGYRDVLKIVTEARRKSGGKPVVIALYLPADRATNVQLANALILSAGGTRIEIGERDRLLSDPYFPNHQPLPPDLIDVLRRYTDFVVRYGEWLGPAAVDLNPSCATAPDGIWAIPRRAGEWQIVNLVNTTGLGDDPKWDEPHPSPKGLVSVPVTIEVDGLVSEVWWASPDQESCRLQVLAWRQDGSRVHIELPSLEFWSLLAVKNVIPV
jgi:dextranase